MIPAQRLAPGRRRALAAATALLAAATLPSARGASAPPVSVRDAWIRGTVEGQTGSGAYLEITSREDAQLVGASAPFTDRVEVHEMREVDGRMTMRRIERLALPANTPVALDHDYHLMLIGLHQQLRVGQTLTLTLEILDAHGVRHAVTVPAPVRPLNTVLAAHPGQGR
jgi:copper(I)-binding protein